MPSDKPVEVRAVVSYDKDTVADAKTQAKSEHTTQESIKKATWAAFVAVAVYALITLFMWCQMMKQTRILDGQLSLLRNADRPWIKVGLSVNSPLTHDNNGVHIGFAFISQNIGKSPAENIWMEAQLIAGLNPLEWKERQKEMCSRNASRERLKAIPGYFLFPGDHYTEKRDLQLSKADLDSFRATFPPNADQARLPLPMALVGCAAYTFGTSANIHQTGFTYELLMSDQKTINLSNFPVPPQSIVLVNMPIGGGYFAN